MNSIDVNRRATRIAIEDISAIAAQGVARALAACRAQGIDLTKDEINRVEINRAISDCFPEDPFNPSDRHDPFKPPDPFEPPEPGWPPWPEEPESGSNSLLNMSENRKPLCPSASPDLKGSRFFGVVGGTADAPETAYLPAFQPVTEELLGLAKPVAPRGISFCRALRWQRLCPLCGRGIEMPVGRKSRALYARGRGEVATLNRPKQCARPPTLRRFNAAGANSSG